MKENINEHDMTKKMMDIIRGGFKKLIKENETDEYDRDYSMDIQLGSAEYNTQLQELQTVDVSGKIDSLKVYPNQEKAILKGTFFKNADTADGVDDFNNASTSGDEFDYGETTGNDEEDDNFSGVRFTFMTNSQQPKAEMNDVNVPPEFWTSFNGFFKTWTEEWIVKLRTDYKPKTK